MCASLWKTLSDEFFGAEAVPAVLIVVGYFTGNFKTGASTHIARPEKVVVKSTTLA
tara:strand:+ start:378 stop:545 length:168 start_codon:yes stop_codon:yes gene_type:complete